MSVGRDRNLALGEQIAVTAGTVLFTIALGRLAGPAVLGRFAEAFSVTLLMAAIQHGLLVSPLMTLAPTAVARDAFLRKLDGLHAKGQLFVATIVGGATAFTVALDSDTSGLVFAAGLYILTNNAREYLRRRGFEAGRAGAVLVSSLVSGALPVGVVLVLHDQQIGALAAILIVAASNMVAVIVVASSLHRDARPRGVVSDDEGRRILRFGAWQAASGLLGWLSSSATILIVAGVSGPALAGGLRAAQGLGSFINVFNLSLESWLPSSYARLANVRDLAAVARTAFVSCAVLGVLGGLLLLLCVRFGRLLLSIVYGSEFAQYAPLVVSAAAIASLSLIGTFLQAALRTLKDGTRLIFGANVLAVVIGLPIIVGSAIAGVDALAVALVVPQATVVVGYGVSLGVKVANG